MELIQILFQFGVMKNSLLICEITWLCSFSSFWQCRSIELVHMLFWLNTRTGDSWFMRHNATFLLPVGVVDGVQVLQGTGINFLSFRLFDRNKYWIVWIFVTLLVIVSDKWLSNVSLTFRTWVSWIVALASTSFLLRLTHL